MAVPQRMMLRKRSQPKTESSLLKDCNWIHVGRNASVKLKDECMTFKLGHLKSNFVPIYVHNTEYYSEEEPENRIRPATCGIQWLT